MVFSTKLELSEVRSERSNIVYGLFLKKTHYFINDEEVLYEYWKRQLDKYTEACYLES